MQTGTENNILPRRPEKWLLLSSKPVDLGDLCRGSWAAVETVNIVYSPAETLEVLAPNQRIATTEHELRELIAGCNAARTLVVEDLHSHDSQQVRQYYSENMVEGALIGALGMTPSGCFLRLHLLLQLAVSLCSADCVALSR